VAAPADLVQGVPLFADLDRRELQGVASSMKERSFNPGQTIATEGQTGIGFFVIAEGTAKVSQGDEERGTLGPGDYFGEIALIDEGLRTASVTADSALTVYGLTSWEFRPLVESNASIAWKLLQTMAKRLREAEGRAGR
jgi:CRP/FNR family transcriptional regulator, cyclic AMP receptor protein